MVSHWCICIYGSSLVYLDVVSHNASMRFLTRVSACGLNLDALLRKDDCLCSYVAVISDDGSWVCGLWCEDWEWLVFGDHNIWETKILFLFLFAPAALHSRLPIQRNSKNKIGVA